MSDRPVVLGYYADWTAATLPPERIDWRLLTHVTHAFAGVGPGGTLRLPERARSRELCRRAHVAGVNVLLALGGASSNRSLSDATASPEGMARLVDALMAAVKDSGYDGIDVDWEAPEDARDRDRMNALVRALRERLPRGATLTMAVPATDWSGRWYDRAALEPYVDYMCVMAYDLHGSWSDHAGHNAPLYPSTTDHSGCKAATVSAALDYWLGQKKWPTGKVLLGVPLYGRGFRAAKWGDPAAGDYARSSVTLRDVPPLVRAGWKACRDEAARVPYLVSPDRATPAELISYEDERSAREKGALARTRGIGGIFFWELSEDHDGLPTVRAARQGLMARH